MLLVKLLKPIAALVSYLRFKTDRLRLARLMARGLSVGKNVYIMSDVEFDWGYPFLIEIGDNCRISKGVRVLAHDATLFRDLGVTRIAPVRILEGTFIGERAVLLPGVTIGPRALIAAGSLVNRDIPEGAVAAGNPARPYGKFSEMLSKYGDLAKSATVFKKEEIEQGTVTHEDLIDALDREGTAFIRGVPAYDPFYINADYARMRANALEAYDRLQSEPSLVEAGAS